jgi:two-component system, OmpR family, KDP operon response regulator KdpE
MDKRARILVVDDEPQILRALRIGLSAHGYDPLFASSGQECLELVALRAPHLVVLDLALPDMDGFKTCQRIRAWSQVPIIVLSSYQTEGDKVRALDLGADDYLTKPFGMEELLARIRAHLRRWQAGQKSEAVFTTGDLTIDFSRRVVTVNGEEVKLTRTEYEILHFLGQNAGKVITHRQLLHAVWGPGYQNETQYLRVHIGNLRRKIEPSLTRPRYILTDPGVGYRLQTLE